MAMMCNAADIATLIETTPALLHPLRHLAESITSEAWLASGFIRNPVWDVISGFPLGTNPPGDIDVVRFDSTAIDPIQDQVIEASLARTMPGLPWQVRNQARMADRNQDPPYLDLAEAIAHWPETATAIAVRWTPAGIALLAPHGLDDLLAMRLRPTPRFARDPTKMRSLRDRWHAKAWTTKWPALISASEFG